MVALVLEHVELVFPLPNAPSRLERLNCPSKLFLLVKLASLFCCNVEIGLLA